MLTLLTEPEAADRLRRDPTRMPAAVEEILRIHAITDLTTPKLAAADMVVGGCPVAAGDGLFPLVAAANHDPDVFPDPERFDLDRVGRGHLTFGTGVHACLGQNLARAEIEIVLSTVLTRVPSMRLAVPVEDLDLDREAIVWGVRSLPVTWS
jgi:cytochrome P450